MSHTIDDFLPGHEEDTAPGRRSTTLKDYIKGGLQYVKTSAHAAGEKVADLATGGEYKRLKNTVEELRHQASIDSLTGLYCNGAVYEELSSEIERASRTHQPLSVVMIDIDHFKDVNDTYGHQAGDEVLQDISSIMQQYTRSIDTACRYGGEEFALILPDTDKDGAYQTAERLREHVAGYEPEQLPQVTISLGVTSYIPPASGEDGLEAKDLVQRADNMLYRAKEGGRNQVCCYEGVSENAS